jgi:hypothetical protein
MYNPFWKWLIFRDSNPEEEQGICAHIETLYTKHANGKWIATVLRTLAVVAVGLW